jgi:hypothetical protein
MPGGVEAEAVTDAHHVLFDDHLTQLLDGPQPAGPSAIADEPGHLAPPFVPVGVDEVLQAAGVAVVVLGGDEHEGVGGLEDRDE